ncbi:MAG: hypothetical protein ABI074_15235 [Nakamurella sp.]
MNAEASPPPPPSAVALGVALVLVAAALGVWGYLLVLGDDDRGVIAPVVEAAAAFTVFGLRTEPTLARWRPLLTVLAAGLGLVSGVLLVSLTTVWVVG